jgi:SAM-dependent methyltransferase
MTDVERANDSWRSGLEGWAIPPELIAAAPQSPYFFDPRVFTAAADEAISRVEDSPSDRVAREVLDERSTVVDVGVGAGAASLRLSPAHITGVDPSRSMLDEFGARAGRLGIAHEEVEGVWPDLASDVPAADVVVCHHVVYNVADLAGFAAELDAHARRRVVIEFTAVHPMTWMAPYWRALHGIEQPDRPTANDAVGVLSALGFNVSVERWRREVQMIGEHGDEQLARMARRLCIGDDRLQDLRSLLADQPPPRTREVVTVWW